MPMKTIEKRRRRGSPKPQARLHLGRTLAALLIGATFFGCSRPDADPLKATANLPTDETRQATTPPPPGDSTPKPADEQTRTASQATDATSRSPDAQSTVGSAAAGAPPYTLNGAPEGNPAPKGGEPPKK